MITSHTNDEQNIVIHYDTDAESTQRFTIWFAGCDRHVVTEKDECLSAVWERVCKKIIEMRHNLLFQEFSDPHQRMSAGLMRGNRSGTAHVYAGITPTRQQVAGHMKQFITWTLYQLACPRRNKNAMERIAALGALAEIHLHQPQTVYVTLPTLAELDAEIARR
jgi:hypothetical protein